MSKGQYDSIRYIGQEFHHALRRMFKKKESGEPPIRHTDNEAAQDSWLSYSILGLEVRLHISKRGSGYHLVAMVGEKGSDDLETRFDEDIHLKRSKEGRINPDCLDKFAQASLNYLKDYYRARHPKQ